MILSERNPNVDAALARADNAATELIKSNDENTQHKKSPKSSKSAKFSKSSSSPQPKSKKAQPKGPTAADLSTINLPGEQNETVPIYLTAADVRKQIKQYLSHTKIAKTAFARELNELMPETKIEVRQMDRFLKATGPKGAGHNPVFYAGYVFFEKKRIRDGKNMTKKREEMEKIWKKSGGVPRNSPGYVFCVKGDKPWIDTYGREGIWSQKTGNSVVKQY
ncbi:unnamed protein product [Cercospora beticola]|nr:unnamed protein product [Cercospora beticola]